MKNPNTYTYTTSYLSDIYEYIWYHLLNQSHTYANKCFSCESHLMGYFSIDITNETLQNRKISLMPHLSTFILHYMAHFPSPRTLNKLNQLFWQITQTRMPAACKHAQCKSLNQSQAGKSSSNIQESDQKTNTNLL